MVPGCEVLFHLLFVFEADIYKVHSTYGHFDVTTSDKFTVAFQYQ